MILSHGLDAIKLALKSMIIKGCDHNDGTKWMLRIAVDRGLRESKASICKGEPLIKLVIRCRLLYQSLWADTP